MVELEEGQYAYRGFVFGKDTDFPLGGPIQGLVGFEARVSDSPLPRGHGDVPGDHYNAARQMLLPLTLGRDTIAELEDALALISATFESSVNELDELEWLEHGQIQRMVRCRPVDFKPGYRGTSGRIADPKVALQAADPRIYSAEEHQVSIPLYTPGGGAINFPVNFPKNFPAGVPLEAVANNAGAADAYPTFRWFGPATGTVTEVAVTNMTTGEDIVVTTPIAAGQILTLDGTAWVTRSGGLVVSLDGSSRYGAWAQPREALRLVPGDNVLRFQITGSATAVPCIATWRDTWFS